MNLRQAARYRSNNLPTRETGGSICLAWLKTGLRQ